MTWAIINMFVPVSALTHEFADHLDDGFIVDVIIVRANYPCFTHRTFVENEMNRLVMVVNVDPVADLLAGTIELWLDIRENVGDLTGNEFFNVLTWSVIV